MGWATGSCVLTSVWARVRDRVKEDERVDVLADLMRVFANYDCDTLDEVICDEFPETEKAYRLFRAKRDS